VSDRIKLAQLIEEIIAGEDKLISNSELDEKSIAQLRELDQVKCELIQSLREIGICHFFFPRAFIIIFPSVRLQAFKLTFCSEGFPFFEFL
jgi:hypothetical protein